MIGTTVAVLIALFELGSNGVMRITQERYIGKMSAFFVCEIENVPRLPRFVTREKTPEFKHHIELIQYREYLRMIEEISSALEHNSSKNTLCEKA